MMKNKYWIFLLLSLITISSLFAQVSQGGMPRSLELVSKPIQLKSGIPVISLPYVDNMQAQQEADNICTDCNKKYYGKIFDYNLNIKAQGQVRTLGNEGRVWLLKITSETAYGMQFYFSRFHLPPGASVYIFDEDMQNILGAYTQENNPVNSDQPFHLGVQPIAGKNIIIEYFEPNNPEFEGELIVSTIAHIFRDAPYLKSNPGGSGTCHIDVACPQGRGWEKEINSVALVIMRDDTWKLMGECSGSLINKTNSDGDPLFLLANHCSFDRRTYIDFDPNTWLFVFNYHSLSCGGMPNILPPSIYGATILSRDEPGLGGYTDDYLLLRLNCSKEDIKRSELCYAGWSLNPNPQGPFVGIHHPMGDVKKISFAENIHSHRNYFAGTFTEYWKLNWDQGSTESGSSGSPLFDASHRIIGFYSNDSAGGCNGTLPANADYYYGKLTRAWELGGFGRWLDDAATGRRDVNTYCPAGNNTISYINNSNGSANGVHCFSKLSSSGFAINGNKDNYQTVCLNNPVQLEALPLNERYCNRGIFPYESVLVDGKCSSLSSDPYIAVYVDPIRLGLLYQLGIKCRGYYHKILVSIIECNSQYNEISGEYYHWTKLLEDEKGSFNLLNHLPSGIQLQPNRYYRLKVAGVYYNNGVGQWDECVKYIHTRDDDVLSYNNALVVGNPSAKEIYIQNSIIDDNVEIKAKNLIEIKDGVTINSGYFDNDNNVLSCNNSVDLRTLLGTMVFWMTKYLGQYLDQLRDPETQEPLNTRLYKMQFDLERERFAIKSGVNMILGRCALSDSYMSFGGIVASKNHFFNLAFNEIVIEAISEVDYFEVNGNTLYLYQNNEVVMEFEMGNGE